MKTQNDTVENNVSYRFYRALGPVLGGLLLDTMDLVTFGPMGIIAGWLLGGLITYWIGSFYNISMNTKLWMAFLGAIYCTIPSTEIFPLATFLAVLCRFFENPNKEQYKSTIDQNEKNKIQD